MKIEANIDDRAIDRMVAEVLDDYRSMLKGSVVGYSSPVHSSDPAKEKKEIEKDLKALKRVIRMYK